jgi:hypothetical protein
MLYKLVLSRIKNGYKNIFFIFGSVCSWGGNTKHSSSFFSSFGKDKCEALAGFWRCKA